MGIATGITAERMLELANGFLVSGHVDENGNLILANGGGQTQNAGNVKGPKGDAGLKGDTGLKGDVGPKGADAAVILTPMSVTDVPSAYPIGISTFSISDATTNGVWPSWPGTVETIRHSVNRTIQIFAEKNTGKTWIRTENDSNGWGIWNQTSYVGHTHAATDVTSGLLNSARLEGSVPRGLGQITSVVDWNTLTGAGVYDVNTLGANSPTGAYAWGVLDVITSAVGSTMAQIYYTHGTPRSIFQRVKYGPTSWSVWSETQNIADTQTTIAARFADGTSSPMLPARLQPTAQDISNGDIKLIKNTGFYKGSAVTNAPGTSWYWYEVIRHDDSYVNYVAYDYFSDMVWHARWQSGNWKNWYLVADGDTGLVDFSSSVSLKTGITYSADGGAWGGLQARRKNGVIHFIVANLIIAANYFKAPGATGSNPTLPADGNIANVTLFSGIPATYRPPAGSIGTLSSGSAGNINVMYVDELGNCILAWFDGQANVATAQTISGAGTFLA